MMIYTNIVDSINKRKFEVNIPSTYNPRFGELLARPELPVPLYNPDEGGVDYSCLSIKYIVDMCFHNVPFTLRDPDAPEVIRGLLFKYISDFYPYKASMTANDLVFLDRSEYTYKVFNEIVEEKLARIEQKRLNTEGVRSVEDIFKRIG